MHRKSSFHHLLMAGMIGVIALVLFWGISAEAGPASHQANGYYYTVQKGDTLWDLSRRFADSPWVWPQLWTENADAIANPHLIYPGQKIRLARKKGAPASAAWEDQSLVEGVHFHYSLINQVGFVRKEPVAPHAVIFEARDKGRTLLAEGDIVYLKPENGATLSAGQLLSAYRTFDRIYDKTTRDYIGIQHLLLGVVKVLQSEPDYAVGELIRSYRPIKISDKLMPFAPRSADIRYEPSSAGIDGAIFEVEEPLSRFAEFHTAFINRGKAHGLREGQLYGVYRRDDEIIGTKGATKKVSIPVDFGELLVLHVEEDTATVLMTDSDREFITGARIRTPALQAR